MAHSERVTKSYASAGTEVETVFLDVGHHGGSMGGHLNESRIMANAPAVVREVINAEKEGWNAVFISGEYDVGAEFSRHVVKIPVIDAGTASLHAAALLGDSVNADNPDDCCTLCPETTSALGHVRSRK